MKIEDIKVSENIFEVVCSTDGERSWVMSILTKSGLIYGCLGTPVGHFDMYPSIWICKNEFTGIIEWWECKAQPLINQIQIPASDFISANTILLDHTYELQAKIESENK